MVNKIEELDMGGTYSYADYLQWKFEEYVELIRGKVFRMSPAPSSRHQSVSVNFLGQFFNLLSQQNLGCQLFHAPFDVRLFAHDDPKKIKTVVQPDICIICDSQKIDRRGCLGAPEFVLEILSPSTTTRDLVIKKDLYEEAGVKEYWIVQPKDQSVHIYLLRQGALKLRQSYWAPEKVPMFLFSGWEVDLARIFPTN